MKEKVNHKDDGHILLFVVVWVVFFTPFIWSKVGPQLLNLSVAEEQQLQEACDLSRLLCNTGNQKACEEYNKLGEACDEFNR